MMKRILMVLAMLSFGTATSYAQSIEVEPNNTVATANVILPGVQVERSFYGYRNVDYFKLNLFERQKITVSLLT